MGTRRINTNSLKPNDLVMGCEVGEIMVPAGGLYVDRIEVVEKQYYGVWVWWRGATQPELFNPYWTWFVTREETQNGTT